MIGTDTGNVEGFFFGFVKLKKKFVLQNIKNFRRIRTRNYSTYGCGEKRRISVQRKIRIRPFL
jgi:hypothetical protein